MKPVYFILEHKSYNAQYSALFSFKAGHLLKLCAKSRKRLKEIHFVNNRTKTFQSVESICESSRKQSVHGRPQRLLNLWKPPQSPRHWTTLTQHSSFVQQHSSSATMNLRSRWICFNKVSADTIGLHFGPDSRNTPISVCFAWPDWNSSEYPVYVERTRVCLSMPCVFVWNTFEYNIPPCLIRCIVPVSVRSRRLETCLISFIC